MNRDNDMAHVKSAHTLRDELAAGKPISGIYGDACSGMTFSDEEAKLLARSSRKLWRTVPAGPGITFWTIINCEDGGGK